MPRSVVLLAVELGVLNDIVHTLNLGILNDIVHTFNLGVLNAYFYLNVAYLYKIFIICAFLHFTTTLLFLLIKIICKKNHV